MAHSYQQVPTDPPTYEQSRVHPTNLSHSSDDNSNTNNNNDDDDIFNISDSDSLNIEQFEIEEPLADSVSVSTQLLERANHASQVIRSSFNSKVINPVSRILDPIVGLFRYLSVKFDLYLSKIGNPLIMRRLLYIAFVSAIIYVIVTSGLYPSSYDLSDGNFTNKKVLYEHIQNSININSMQENLEYLSSVPHVAGTEGDLALARYINNIFKQDGLNPMEFNQVEAFINYPNESSLNLLSSDANDTLYQATLIEDYEIKQISDERNTDNNDNSGSDKKGNGKEDNDHKEMVFPDLAKKAFNYLSTDGQVTGKILYVNYGREIDFQLLNKNKINVGTSTQSVCFMKYGKIPVSSKLKISRNNGCDAIVIFDDPNNYSHLSTDEINNLNINKLIHKQMASNSNYATGDVLTPGWATTSSSMKLSWDQSNSNINIPIMPISLTDAHKFLSSIKGNGLKIDPSKDEMKDWNLKFKNLDDFETWTGDLNEKNLQAFFKSYSVKRDNHALWNVVGKIFGSEQSEKAIIIGAKRDSSCFGTINPNTGTAVLMELVKIYTKMTKIHGWKPLRTIYFISIDGSNYNFAGLTEWVEARLKEIRKEIYAYIDLSDAIGGQDLKISSHPAFSNLIMEVLQSVDEINQPDTSQKRNEERNGNEPHKKISDSFKKENICSLKEYKNYVPFLSYAGIPSIEIKYTNSKNGNIFENTCMDNFKNFEDLKIDPQMIYHRKLVEILSHLIVELVDDPLIPMDLNHYGQKLEDYLRDLDSYTHKLFEEYKSKSNKPDDQFPLNYNPLRNALTMIKKFGKEYLIWKKTWNEILLQEGNIEPSLLSIHRWKWNTKLCNYEKKLVDDNGYPNRPWYKNLLFGPSSDKPEIFNTDISPETEYEWWTFPTIRDAIDNYNWELAQKEVEKISRKLTEATNEFTI
ncbi:putative zinc metalloprotease [Ascoidea rubescens DSM 1968]|uniref:Zn-dependent exopeptidase n=1 Tax=Ascoidea rubescens DSM 1968 TaxID=1344418 RepID=A0A1D2VN38_9ASCO|nr:Zn-dependent exopeptidase [Ascoidea rubescens DSM 1968]ODV63028.1 Zn-dependent exopeptidase [Ascoidea rubescens DSM 1968]